VRVGILLTCGKQLHYRIISLRVKIWAHKVTLTSPLIIEIPILNQENERAWRHMCTRGIDCVSFFSFLRFSDWMLQLFWRCDIFCFYLISNFQVDNAFISQMHRVFICFWRMHLYVAVLFILFFYLIRNQIPLLFNHIKL